VPAGPLGYGSATASATLTGNLNDNDFVPTNVEISRTVAATIVDANIQITPSETNKVGDDHTFTAHVNTKLGTPGYVNAADGTLITFTYVSDSASSTPIPPTSCTTAGGTGSCTTTITSLDPGVTVVAAHTSVVLGGLTVSRSTDGDAGNSDPATKTWVDARINDHPDGTNQVTNAHTFNVTTEANDGSGWAAVSGTITATSTDFGTITGGTCTVGASTPARSSSTRMPPARRRSTLPPT
jgi:hypothetical protein